MNNTLDQVIATTSVMLAVVTALLGIWYADVSGAIDEETPRLPAEKKTLRNKLAPIFWSKSLPLAIGSTMVAGVFAHRFIGAIESSVSLLGHDWRYDDMKAAFISTELMLIALALVAVTMAVRLAAKCLGLR